MSSPLAISDSAVLMTLMSSISIAVAKQAAAIVRVVFGWIGRLIDAASVRAWGRER